MKFDVLSFFPKCRIADCEMCHFLFGFTDDDVLEFTCENYPEKTIEAITCPNCDSFLLLPDLSEDEDTFGQNQVNYL